VILILDIGCGKKKRVAATIGLDRQPASDADVSLCELAHFPWPLRDSCANQVYLSHFLEHQPDVLRAMAEVHRIAKPGAEVVVTQHFSSMDFYTDPTHLVHLGIHSFDYFVQESFENFIYGAGGFRILDRRLTFGHNFLLDNLGRIIAGISMDFYEKHFAWIFPARNILCRLSVVK
jgi:hypothetical protein